jgi:hypothetical protein
VYVIQFDHGKSVDNGNCMSLSLSVTSVVFYKEQRGKYQLSVTTYCAASYSTSLTLKWNVASLFYDGLNEYLRFLQIYIQHKFYFEIPTFD